MRAFEFRVSSFEFRVAAIPVLVLGLMFSPRASAQSIELQGYAKNLALRSSSVLSGDDVFLDITRFRVQALVDAGPRVHAEAWLDTEMFLGSFLRSADFILSESLQRSTWLDLDWVVGSTGQYRLQQSLFRAFVAYHGDDLQLSAGRQRIAWGSGFVWNPTDLLNPINPTTIERDEKGGVDALHAVVPLGPLSQVEGVWAIGRTADLSSYAARYGFNVSEYDIALMGGYFREAWVWGGEFAGYLGDAGLRGEWAVTHPPDGDAQLRATLNTDYNFAGGYYTLFEFHYNGPGASRSSDYDLLSLLSGTTFNLARLYGALVVSKSVSPLVAVSGYTLANFNDGSGLIGPAITWSATQNMEIALSTYLFAGNNRSEFGRLGNVLFGSIQIYF